MIAAMLTLATAVAAHCVATDGDSIRCGHERIRLLGIDAPEISRCQAGRHCAPGDPIASRDNLRLLIDGKTLSVERVGKDHYGRTLAVVHAGGMNLSCHQLRGYAIYRKDWDDGRRIAKACPDHID